MVRLLEHLLPSFCDELEKIAEYAKGIPSKSVSHDLPTITAPVKWEYGVQKHDAVRRGKHLDLRLGDPDTGHAHSWAMQEHWPKPGESAWAIQQPTHTVKYMDFAGEIPSGYGKGQVAVKERDKVEVVSSKPGHINFNLYRGSGPEEYTLHRLADKKWKLFNRTSQREKLNLPESKPKYKDTHMDTAHRYVANDEWIASAKIDDAHNLFVFPSSGEQVRVVSYRVPKRGETGVIEHTHKVPSLIGVRTPKELSGTVLRGGLYAMNPRTGKATEAKDIAGMLNTNVWKSREKQEHYGELVPVVYDVVRYKGKNMENAPYGEKLRVLREAVKHSPLSLPPMATTRAEKDKLVDDIESGKIPETKEGVVFWNLSKSTPAVKAKFIKDHDVYVRELFPGEGKYKGNGVGGFKFSHTPDGPIVGSVGTGLSDALRRDMHMHPDRYKGLVASVVAQGKFKSQALRAPAFKTWHLDKNDPEDLAAVKT